MHVAELSEETPQLVGYEAQDASATFFVRRNSVFGILVGRWSSGMKAEEQHLGVKSGRKTRTKTYPSGCWSSDARSSTAVDDAIEAKPGRVTVHIWSRVLSVKDFGLLACIENHDMNAVLTSDGATMSLQ